jgi:hypothetical protein
LLGMPRFLIECLSSNNANKDHWQARAVGGTAVRGKNKGVSLFPKLSNIMCKKLLLEDQIQYMNNDMFCDFVSGENSLKVQLELDPISTPLSSLFSALAHPLRK